MTTAEALRAAQALIPDKAHWWRGKTKQTKKFCPITAIAVNYDPESFMTICEYFEQAIGGQNISDWNDSPERTLAEVHAAFDRAIELAEKANA